MTTALLYQSANRWRFGVALAVAAMIHLAAVTFATARKADPASPAGFVGEAAVITLDAEQPPDDRFTDPADPLLTPPTIDPSYFEERPTPPARHQVAHIAPVVRANSPVSRSLSLSTAKVLAINAPRPEYPYEARRQKITGDGIVIMTVDAGSGIVVAVTMSKSTGNELLDNAALTGFKRWRFRPGTVSSVTCPVTFTLTGFDY